MSIYDELEGGKDIYNNIEKDLYEEYYEDEEEQYNTYGIDVEDREDLYYFNVDDFEHLKKEFVKGNYKIQLIADELYDSYHDEDNEVYLGTYRELSEHLKKINPKGKKYMIYENIIIEGL